MRGLPSSARVADLSEGAPLRMRRAGSTAQDFDRAVDGRGVDRALEMDDAGRGQLPRVALAFAEVAGRELLRPADARRVVHDRVVVGEAHGGAGSHAER